MPGKWGGTHRVRPPRSPNELGCQANGGARAGHAPPRSANVLECILVVKRKAGSPTQNTKQCVRMLTNNSVQIVRFP